MRAVLRIVRNLWCAVTDRCALEVPDDPYVQWMAEQEEASIRARRQRRQNFLEAELLRKRMGGNRT